jgi:hypothetical protein
MYGMLSGFSPCDPDTIRWISVERELHSLANSLLTKYPVDI